MKHQRLVIPADKVWQAKKPRYNGFACGHGAHRNRKAYRRKAKHARPYNQDEYGVLALLIMLPIIFLMIGAVA